jgi:hypothetical protein
MDWLLRGMCKLHNQGTACPGCQPDRQARCQHLKCNGAGGLLSKKQIIARRTLQLQAACLAAQAARLFKTAQDHTTAGQIAAGFAMHNLSMECSPSPAAWCELPRNYTNEQA